jgi:hypothetical protein
MRLGRLIIVRAGYPPYVPNWGRYEHGIAINGWCFTVISRETLKEMKSINQLWKS